MQVCTRKGVKTGSMIFYDVACLCATERGKLKDMMLNINLQGLSSVSSW